MKLKRIMFISIFLLLTAECASAYTLSYTNLSSDVINFETPVDTSPIDTITLNNTINYINFFQADNVPGTIRVQDTANISLLDTAKGNPSSTFQAREMYSLGLFSVDPTENSLVNEFEVSNIAKNNTPTTIVSGTSTSGFFSYVGNNNTTFSISNKRVKASGTTDSSGRFYVRKSTALDLSGKEYISFNINCSQSGLLYFGIASSLGNSKVWNAARFPVTANEVTHFVLPIKAPAGTYGENPSSTPGTIVMSSVSNIYIGMTGAKPDSNVSVYVDNIASDNGKPAYIELQTPDNLSPTSVKIESWNGAAYETFATYGANSSYNSLLTDTTKLRNLDGTKWDDVFGVGRGRAFYPKGNSGDIVLGSDNTTMTYQNTEGSIKKIGLRFDLPPSDSRTDFNKARFRVTTYYASPTVTYNLNSVTPITLTYSDNNNLLYNSANNPNIVAPMSFNIPNQLASQWNSIASNPITLEFDSSTDINEISINLPTQIIVNDIICKNTSVLYSPEITFSTSNQTSNQMLTSRASVTIKNSAQNLRDFQIHATIQGNDPTASNYVDFSKTTGDDIKVTDSDGVTKLPYWIESWDTSSKTGSIWVKVPRIPVTQAPQYFKFSTSSTLHNDYGLSYPVTYEFNIPAGSSSLKAFKKYNLDDSWTQITEKESTDFFNGIEAVRFDYTNNKAYVSVAFDANSNDIYLEILDSNDNQVGTYQQIDKYYDNRKAAVVITGDDWWESSDSNFTSFSNLCAQDKLWFSVGIITNSANESPNWTSIQNAINNGYVEPCSHSRTHKPTPYADYDSEIGGSKTDIINNLSLPDLNKRGNQEYVYSWIEPGGYTDSNVTKKLGEYKYLSDRSVRPSLNNFYSTWDSINGLYYRFGPTIEADDHNISSWAPSFPGTSQLNSEFDKVVNTGGIYTLYFHPDSVTTTELSPHFDYIKQRNDIWYVGMGHLYLYDFINRQTSREDTQPEISQSGYPLYIYYGNSTASSLSNFSNVFTKNYGGSGLVGLWHMDEGSGPTVADSSGKGNTGTITDATWSTNDGGQWGNRKDITFSQGSSLQFNGVSSSVDCGNKPSLQLSKTFTIAAWVNYQGTSSSKSWNSIVDKGKVEWTAPYNGFYLGYKANTNSWQFKVANNNVSSDTIYYTQPYSAVYNQNHFVTATFDNGIMKLYIDGILVSSKVSAVTDVGATLNNLKIGMSSAYNQNWFNGNIDEVRIYNRVLTEEEINSYYLRSKYAYPLPQCS